MARLEDIIAEGSHKTVEPIKDNPNAVRATFRMRDYGNAYGTYLLGKLSNILFPDVMPKLLAFGKHSDGSYYMDIERVALDVLHLQQQALEHMYMFPKKLDSLYEENNEHEITYYKRKIKGAEQELTEITKRFADAGLPFDPHAMNWTHAENRVRNVDFKSAWMDAEKTHRHFDPDKIRAHIALLGEEKRKDAEALLGELLALEKREL